MKASAAVAEILKHEGIDFLIGYPVNPIIEAAAQAYGDSVPIVVLPGGYPRRLTNIPPNFNSFLNFRHVTKWCEQVTMPDAVPDAMRRAFTQVKNGRPRPVLVEIPTDVFQEEIPEPLN